MPEILDLGMYDEDYLQLIAQGRDPVQEKITTVNLIRAGVPPEQAYQVAELFYKSNLSVDEEAVVRSTWMWILS